MGMYNGSGKTETETKNPPPFMRIPATISLKRTQK
jgi:hypothetical protein